MFLFKCCQQYNSGVGYEVRRDKTSAAEFISSVKELKVGEAHHEKTSIVKIKKSQYDEVFADYTSNKKKFIDHEFQAQQNSLGSIEGLEQVRWKRISQIIKDPVLLGPRIEPNQLIQGSLSDCYFLSALAALAEKEERIRSIFEGQSYNAAGIYKAVVRINGELEEIIVDDFVPVNKDGQPLFCQPFHNQFWVLILQKIWAKVNGSYGKIVMGTPTSVFKGFTMGSADVLTIKNKNEEKQRLWNVLKQYSEGGHPMVCLTKQEMEKDTPIAGGLSYTLLASALLQDVQGVYHKVIKLRDLWGRGMWEGACSEKDRAFWTKIVMSQQRKQFEKKHENGTAGIFYINFNDFCNYFSRIHYCLLYPNYNYNAQPVFINKKNGRLFQVQVKNKGSYYFSLHQSEIYDLAEQDQREEGICRSTMLLIRKNANGFEYINGVLKYNEQDVVLSEVLDVGSYLLFAKIDPTRTKHLIPNKTFVSVYSPSFTLLESVQKQKYPDLLKKAFLQHARGYKKNKYNNGLMWISWKLLLQQGGYAYVAMGVDPQSNKKFVIDFTEEDFNTMSFKLKGEFKGKGNQRIQVLPGEQKIILARVDNQLVKTLKFPPNLGIKMELVPNH